MQYPTHAGRAAAGIDTDRLPAYAKIERQIRQHIESGHWQPDDMIPTEAQLAEEHKVSIGTVRKALQELAVAGLLYRMQGKGSYVAGSFIRSKNHRFYRTHETFGTPEPITRFAYLRCERVNGLEPACQSLSLPTGTPLIRLERLLTITEQPFVLVYSHFEAQRFAGLVDESPERFEKEALTLIIEKSYATPTMSAVELCSAATALPEIASILGLAANAPLLCLEMLCCSYNEKPFEYRQSYCVPGRKLYRSY